MERFHRIFRALALALALALPRVSGLYTDGSVVAPCDSPLYCHGDILRQVQLARPFADSKTFVDMPAVRPLADIRAAFDALPKPLSNDSVLHGFLRDNFAPPGSELKLVPRERLTANATFLGGIRDAVVREFVGKVMDLWPDFVRVYDPPATGACGAEGCPDSYLAVNGSRPFFVAGGLGARFREPYYWDSYWTLLGLLRTGGSFTEVVRNQIENFLDFVEEYGFVPNGARLYYLNRSQPPVLALMVREYLAFSGDASILDRAVPLLIREHRFWEANRSVAVTVDGTAHVLNRYAVANTEPRPESYREDVATATNSSYHAASGLTYPQKAPLSDAERAELYANLATGAETGWDFSSRWLARPGDAVADVHFPLRSLNAKAVVPVDLNAILYGNEMAIGGFLRLAGRDDEAAGWESRARRRSEAMFRVMWNETHFRYFDYNLTSDSQCIFVPADADADADAPVRDQDQDQDYVRADEDQSVFRKPGNETRRKVYFNAGQFFPFWTGAVPDHIRTSPLAVHASFAPVARHLDTHPGGIPATNLATQQQWDQPNVWPPLMHVLIAALQSTPATLGTSDPAHVETQDLALRLAQRYVDSTFCTWYATGGSTAETPALPGLEHRGGRGVMFEKYVDWAVDAAGGGGEYEVVEGFGWTNGVLAWVADAFGDRLARPDCGNLTAGAGSEQ